MKTHTVLGEEVGTIDNRGSWPRGDLNERGRVMPHKTKLFLARDDPYPPDEVLQVLEAWVNDYANIPSEHYSRNAMLSSLLDHFELEVVKYAGADDPDYLGPTYRVVRKGQ